jgi:hypothetical protein
MKRIFSHPVTALAAGLCLRLFFIIKHPMNSADTVLYEQLATNWLQHHVYAMNVDDAIRAVDLRVPGYPAFLALIYRITGRIGQDARFYVMLAQAAVDLCACLVTAGLAAMLARLRPEPGCSCRAFSATLWVAALCPFTANYTAVPLTETFAGFFTAAAFAAAVGILWKDGGGAAETVARSGWMARRSEAAFAFAAGFLIGMGTLFRPETPMLLVILWVLIAFVWLKKRQFLFGLRLAAVAGLGCVLPLIPWAVRNYVTLHEVQFLAPKNTNMPGEFVPYGFMAWEKTWLYKFSDCYLVPWKLGDETINLEDIPSRAFDSPEEKERVGALLEQYNNDVTITAEEDAAFGQIARERTARHPLRTYLWVPVLRGFTIWFTPRIELLPFSGKVWPVKEAWQEDPIDFSFTVGFFTLGVLYVALALWGAARLWRENHALQLEVAFFFAYIFVRTAFLTTLETPEPRYVLVCFPAVFALAGQVFARCKKPTESAAAVSA